MKTGLIAACVLVAGAWLSLGGACSPTCAHAGSLAGFAGQDDDKKPVMALGTGGSAQNINDIAWVLTTDTYVHPKTKKSVERKVLLCYRVGNNGKLVDIVDVRDITWDVKFNQLPVTGHNPDFTPSKMYKAWLEKQKRDEEDD